MKRIEAFVPNTKRSKAVEAAIKAGAEGVTIAETRGKGQVNDQWLEVQEEQQDTLQNTAEQTHLSRL